MINTQERVQVDPLAVANEALWLVDLLRQRNSFNASEAIGKRAVIDELHAVVAQRDQLSQQLDDLLYYVLRSDADGDQT